ncbi:hypothetical protein CKA32_001676 [Geitlerinema sp. FC II]|nr:hypothetical protein CKA32_001676 [Geitlerinema sp. FC II]
MTSWRSILSKTPKYPFNWVHLILAIATPPILPLLRGGAEGGGVFLRT